MYVLGIDGGTEAVKAAIFDAEGNLVALGMRPYATYFPRPGWAEQDPSEWWDALVGAVHDCLEMSPINPEEICSISADATTCTLVPMRASGEVLRRALLWMDVRANSQAERIFQTEHEALRYSLAGVSAEWMAPKALWLKENEPELFDQTNYFIEYTDWIAYRLTGRFVLNLDTVTQRWYYHVPSGGWPSDFFEEIGLGEIERKFPHDVLRVGEIVGPLSASAARALGLHPGTPVVTGGGDAFVGMLGLGVVGPGDLGVVMGSSNVISGFSTEEVHFPGIFGSFPEAIVPGLNLFEGGQVSTGSILNWFKRHFAGDAVAEAAERGVSVYQLLDEEARCIEPGSDGLIILDYFQGNRTPHTDSLARGVVVGLSLQTSRAHVFRAMMEGIAYGMKDILDTFQRHHITIERIIACGGATRSDLFMQIYSDVTGYKIATTDVAEASLLGSAIAAAVGAGLYPTLSEATYAMVHLGQTYPPDIQLHDEYQYFFENYRGIYQQLKHIMRDMTRHVK